MQIRGLLGCIGNEPHVSVNGVEGLLRVKLRGVEEYGIWVESEGLIHFLLAPSECGAGSHG